MKKGFSILNIVVFFCALAFIYLAYNKYYKPKIATNNLVQNQTSSSTPSQDHSSPVILEPEKPIKPPRAATITKDTPTDEGGNALPDLSTLPKDKPQTGATTSTESPTTTIAPTTNNGYYENRTYGYSLTCLPDWPLIIRSEENVSIGTVPPENGQGAITIEVTTDNVTGEINAAEAEAKKYPGVITLTKEKITIDGVTGDKIVMVNSLVGTTNVYIFLPKNNLNYSIKYAQESPRFTANAETAIQTFKFTK